MGKTTVFLRSENNYDRDAVSLETAMVDDQDAFPSKTIQSGKDEADINIILKRFGVTGQLPPMSQRMPEYGDFTGITDFHSAMTIVRQAQEAFMELPAEVRSRFGNDPGAFINFASDPENLPELRKMGLAKEAELVQDAARTADVPPGGAGDERSSAEGVGRRSADGGKPAKGARRDASGRGDGSQGRDGEDA